MSIRYLSEEELNELLYIPEYSTSKLEGGDEVSKEQENIYLYLKEGKIDNQLLKYNQFVLKPHQTIPKYYLLNHVNKVILHYSMGSGKTAGAIFIASYYLDIYKQTQFLNLYNNKSVHDSKKLIHVIGSWQTQNAFIQDLLKPELHFVDVDQIKQIKEKLNSTFKEIRAEGEIEYNRLIKSILKKIEFYGYQAFFNKCFPDINMQKFTQDARALIEEYKNGLIKIEDKILEEFRDSLIIVDEMQKLYSTNGMNSYGFVLSILMKSASKYNIKFVFLTGTILNTSLYEVVDVMNIMNENTIEDHSTYLDQITILDNIVTYKIKESKIDYIRDYFRNIFIYYSNNDGIETEIEIKKYSQPIDKSLSFYDPQLKKNVKDKLEYINSVNNLTKVISKYDENKHIPTEIHVGNIMIKEPNQIMNIYSVEVEGYQADKYLKYLQEESTMSDLIEGDENVSIHDGIFDKNDNSIYYNSGIYSGVGLKYPNIKKYSAIGAELVRICLYSVLKGEKVVVYHERILGFGLKQYVEILNQNGFILYGTSPKKDTRCKICGNELEHHPNSHDFVPMRYEVMYGDISDKDRKQITQLYNSPNNLYGDYISVIFISSIAYSGVSFFNTNNIVILDKISNLSRWKQIYSRIIRTRSHDLLPKEKKYANVYTMVIQHPMEKRNGINLFTREEKYYKLRVILNNYVNNFISDIRDHSISKILLKEQERISEILTLKNENSIFNQDLIQELNNIFKLNKINLNSPWILKKLIKRLTDPENQLSFINMNLLSKHRKLIPIIIKEKYLKLFYDYLDYKEGKNIFCILDRSQKEETVKYNTKFNFADLNYLTLESSIFKQILLDLTTMYNKIEKLNDTDKDKHVIYIRNQLMKLVTSIKGKFELIINYKIFWDVIYLIHDEYYVGDEKKFLENHNSDKRDYNSIAGFYYYDKVILKPKEIDLSKNKFLSGDSKIEIKEIQLPRRNKEITVPLNDSQLLFKITSHSALEPTIWYLRVVIIAINDERDNRKKNKGINCSSFNVEKLYMYFPNIDKKMNRKNYCIKLIGVICDEATDKKIKIPTPFE